MRSALALKTAWLQQAGLSLDKLHMEAGLLKQQAGRQLPSVSASASQGEPWRSEGMEAWHGALEDVFSTEAFISPAGNEAWGWQA